MKKDFFEKYTTSEVTNKRRIICTPSAFTRKHFFYIQEAGYLKSLKPHLSRRSGLKSYLFMIVLSGSGTVTYQQPQNPDSASERKFSASVYATEGDCFFIDCSNEYTHISSEENPWELLWIHFHGPQADAYYQYFLEHQKWHFRSPHITDLIAIIENILACHEKRDDDTDIRCSNYITNILTLISTDVESSTPNESELSIKLQNVIAYLDAHYTEDISLDFLAEQFYISKFYLSREFKKKYGITIIQYLMTKKITNAKELLRYSNASIEEIASLCGIDDASYFNKVFKKLEGCTASEYRKRW